MNLNYLKPKFKTTIWKNPKFYLWGALFFVLVFSGFFARGLSWPIVLLFLITFILLVQSLKTGIYALFGMGFFIGWHVYFDKYYWSKDIPYLSTLNAPLVDFIALFLFFALIIAIFLGIKKAELKDVKKIYPALVIYILFLAVSFVSALQAYDFNMVSSTKDWARFYVFPFLVFLLPTLYLVKEKKVFKNVLNIIFAAGIFASLMGLSSLFFGISDTWLRATPYTLLGVAFFGYNHNLLAEVLVAVFPVGLYLFFTANKDKQKMYLFGSILILLVGLLTLSRTAWLCFILEILIVSYFYLNNFKSFVVKYKSVLVIFLIGLVLSAGYMFTFLGSNIVSSSNSARVANIDMAMFYFARQPVLGYGPGMYLNVAGDAKVLVYEFGEPLDAHGFIHKILLETGLLGFILWILFLGSVFYVLMSSIKTTKGEPKQLAIFMLSLAGGVILYQVFNTSYFSANMWLPLSLALAGVSLKDV